MLHEKKIITCVTSGGTNFYIWHKGKLAKIKATDAESSSSSIQSAMNQQAKDASAPSL